MDLKKELQVAKCPHDALSLTNCGILNPADMPMGHTLSKLSKRHIRLSPVEYPSQGHVLTVISAPEVVRGTIGLSMAQRKYLNASIGQNVVVTPYDFDERTQFAMGVTLEVDFQNKKKVTSEPFDTEQMANDFLDKFTHQALYVGMLMVFDYNPAYLLSVVVKKLEMVDAEALLKTGSVRSQHNNVGLVFPNTKIVFETSEGGTVRLIGKNKARMTTQNIINPTWDFQQMGIGGLDNEFNAIFRRAFASRVFPPEIVEQLGCKHVKGILLYGPPGTGKTLMARQIGKMLNSREPKIVNGPEILDKYVGQSEANIRLLFAEAEAEEKSRGPNSGLHIIIFDEIDAICKQRGTVGGSTGVHDTVVNQLLSKIDGVEQLNNILVIGMTNRRDMIDEALLRPGRLEVQIEISLPDEKGRRDILQIHTALMRKNGKMDPDVNLDELATLTKNFSGAEIEGLVKAAQSSAMNSLIKAASKIEVDPEAMEKITITRANFLNALENDIKPAFGTSLETLDKFLTRGVIEWGPPISHALEDGMLLIQQARNSHSSGLVSVLLEGPPNSGKSAIAAELAKNSDFPFIKICSPEDMIGFSESAKCSHIKKIFEDAYKSPLSCVLVDNIERLLDYGPIGPRYSNMVLQALLVLLKKQPPKGRKLIIFCTSSRRQVLEEMEMLTAFSSVLNIPNLTRPEFLVKVLHASDAFTKDQVDTVSSNIQGRRLFIGIKKLLDLIDLMRQTSPDYRVSKFLSKLEEEEVIEVR